MNKVYVPKRIAAGIGVAVFIMLIVLGYVFYGAYNKSKLINPLEQFSPIGKIGSASKSLQQVAGTKPEKNKAENVLTIVFFYDGYTSQKQAQLDAEIMQAAIELVEPFKSMKNHLAYKLFTTDTRKCSVDKESMYLVCDKELIESFRTLGVDHFKVVLMSQDQFTAVSEKARGKNSWISIPTNPANLTADNRKEWLGISVTRLLGYSLGLSYESGASVSAGLLDAEISPDIKLQALGQDTRPNCASDKKKAEELWGEYTKIFPDISYFKGCAGDPEAYFPEEGTLMSLSPKKETYGRVSEDYLRGILTCFYGKGESIVFGAGKEATYSASLKSCDSFIKDYPNFWNE